ncbi:Tail-specific protease precursor [Thiorhodovibrio winogradskyi]|uniref:Tail-specific protease n=1 Tax=Thiorhodovibrio winogradskyi TaxID=77007 RepID=A0ABZ0SD78_9GAMM
MAPLLALLLGFGVVLELAARPVDVSLATLFPTERQAKTAVVINQVLERFHYRDFELSPAFAVATLEHYFDGLDPNRSFFLDRDIQRFLGSASRLDDDLAQGRVDVAFDIFRVYRMRVDDRVEFALGVLEGDFDFNKSEHYQFDRTKAPWPRNEAELDELWRKRVKNDYLTLKLADKDDAEIRKQLRKRYEGIRRRIHQFDADDVFQTFVNAYTQSLEPHTAYMSPSTSENFDISMRLSLEGIGAVLRADNEYTVIQRTIPGGPARQSGMVQTGDKIVGVAQGVDGEFDDVVGWRLQDVVDKIRGPKGSVVRLQLLPKAEISGGGRMREVSLVRNEIKLEDQAASSYVIDGPENAPDLRIGVIKVPAFYRDFRAESDGNRDFRSTTRDVRKLLAELQDQRVNGIVIDLRGNGGGSLTEATSLTGLFIKEGPVVQVKDSFGKIEVETDPDPELVYSGPLAVIVDRNSASASEIFAGAIQDYDRGLVVGEPTFGKGTVQTLVDLNRYVPGNELDLGRLRLTMAEFFRISGGSTQLKGVEPDILFDLGYDSDDHGERSLDNALPWSSIRPASYQTFNGVDLNVLRSRSVERTARDRGFRMLTRQGRMLTEIEARDLVSLREDERRQESKRRDKALKEERNEFLRSRDMEPVDEDADPIDEEALEKQQDVIDAIQVDEAARILADLIKHQGGAERPRAAMRD